MEYNIVNHNTLIFKLSDHQNIDNLDIQEDIKHFIADLSDVKLDTLNLIKNKLVKFGQSIYSMNGSFVVVSSYEFDDNLNIVPTINEAIDFIELEEIERQLEL